jgi:hypothetical protein
MKMGPIDFHEKLVINRHYRLRNSPEECRSEKDNLLILPLRGV